jgi:hypothetical protein
VGQAALQTPLDLVGILNAVTGLQIPFTTSD